MYCIVILFYFVGFLHLFLRLNENLHLVLLDISIVKMGDQDSRKLFIGGTKECDEDTLKHYFSGFGEVESMRVVMDQETQRYFHLVTFQWAKGKL